MSRVSLNIYNGITFRQNFVYFFFQLCKKQFQYSASLRAHLIRHTRKVAPTSSASNSTSAEASGTPAEKGRTKREFICSICGRTLPKLYSLRIHMLKHTGVKPHACQVKPYIYFVIIKKIGT